MYHIQTVMGSDTKVYIGIVKYCPFGSLNEPVVAALWVKLAAPQHVPPLQGPPLLDTGGVADAVSAPN